MLTNDVEGYCATIQGVVLVKEPGSWRNGGRILAFAAIKKPWIGIMYIDASYAKKLALQCTAGKPAHRYLVEVGQYKRSKPFRHDHAHVLGICCFLSNFVWFLCSFLKAIVLANVFSQFQVSAVSCSGGSLGFSVPHALRQLVLVGSSRVRRVEPLRCLWVLACLWHTQHFWCGCFLRSFIKTPESEIRRVKTLQLGALYRE